MTNFPALTRVAEPESEPVTLAEAKAYLRFASSADDGLITGLISAVRKAAEEYMRISLITQSWKLSYDKYAPASVVLPFGPAQSVTNVKVFTRDGSETVLSPGGYYLSGGNRRLIFDASRLSHRIEITYVAGYGSDAADVPSPIKYGILAHLAAIYDGKAGNKTIPAQAIEFYQPYREVRV